MKKIISKFSIIVILFAMLFPLYHSMYVTSAESIVTTEGNELIVNGDFSTSDCWTNFPTSKVKYDSTNKYFYITNNGGYILSNLSTHVTPNLVDTVQSGFYKISFKLWKSDDADASVTFTFAKSSEKQETITQIINVTALSKPNYSSSFYFYKYFNEDNVRLKIQSSTQECSSIYIDDVSLVQITTPIETGTGAGIRNSSTDSGIRFRGNINKGVYDYLTATYGEANVKAGMLLAPTNIIDVEDFTIEKLENNNVTYINKVIEKWNNSSTGETDGYYGFNCVIANIKPENLDRKFSARAYFSFKYSSGEIIYIYADYSSENHSRSIYEVASKALESEDLDDNSKNVAESYVNRIINLTADDFEKDSTDTTGMTYTLIKKYYRGVLYCSVPEVVTVLVENNDSKLEAIQNLYYNLSNNENNLKIALSFNNLTESEIQEKLNEIVIKFYVA